MPGADGVEPPDESYRAVFAVPSFTRLTISALCARTAGRMYQVLLVLFTLAVFHSAAISGLVVLASQIPGMIVSPIAGALLDREGKDRLIAIDYFVACCSIAAVTVLSLLHLLDIPILFLIVILSSFTQPLSVVGTRSLFPLMVPRHLWTRANGVDNSGFVVASVAGPAVGGVAVALIGSRWALFLPAALFLGGAASILGVRVPPSGNQRPASLISDAVGALRYVYENRILRLLTLSTAGFNIGGGTITIGLPVIVLRHLHGGSTSVGVLFAVMGIVGFVTGMLAGSHQRIGHERRSLVGSLIVSTIGLCVLAFSATSEWVLITGLVLIGFSSGTYQVCMLSLRQRVTDPAWFGRALAVSMNASGAAFPAASGLIGGLIGHSVAEAFLVAAAISLLGGIWPALRTAESTEAPPAIDVDTGTETAGAAS